MSLLAVLSLHFEIYYQRVTLTHNSVDYTALNNYVNIFNILNTLNKKLTIGFYSRFLQADFFFFPAALVILCLESLFTHNFF